MGADESRVCRHLEPVLGTGAPVRECCVLVFTPRPSSYGHRQHHACVVFGGIETVGNG